MITAIAYCVGLAVRLFKPLLFVAAAVFIAEAVMPERLPAWGNWFGPARAYVVALVDQLRKAEGVARQPEPVSRAPAQRSKPDDIPADRPRGRLVVPVNQNDACLLTAWVNGMPADFLLDSGSYSVALSRRTAAALGIDTARLVYDRQIGTTGGTSWAARITLRELRIGKRVFPNVPADVVQGNMNLIGMPLLRKTGFHVTDGSCELG